MAEKNDFNGQHQHNVEPISLAAHQAKDPCADMLEDHHHNGIPDIFEGTIPARNNTQLITRTRYQYRGQVYDSLEEMPAEIRQIFKNCLPPEPAEPAAQLVRASAQTVGSLNGPAAAGMLDEPHRFIQKWMIAAFILFDLLVALGAIFYFSGILHR